MTTWRQISPPAGCHPPKVCTGPDISVLYTHLGSMSSSEYQSVGFSLFSIPQEGRAKVPSHGRLPLLYCLFCCSCDGVQGPDRHMIRRRALGKLRASRDKSRHQSPPKLRFCGGARRGTGALERSGGVGIEVEMLVKILYSNPASKIVSYFEPTSPA